MKSKNKLNKIDIKNRVCYIFDDIIHSTNFCFNNTLINKTLHENISVYENISIYNIPLESSTGLKPLHVRFDKIDGFIISLNDEIKHLVLQEVVLQIVLFIILEDLELIHIIFYL